MKKWEYNISFHPIHNFDITEEETNYSSNQTIACDTEGHCFYSDVMRLYTDEYRELLNEKGSTGWELVQLGYHKGSLVCIWKREID